MSIPESQDKRGENTLPMPWLLLFVAIVFEVAGITSLKLSRGFAEPIPSIAVPVFYVLSAAAVILALKAIWSGVGTALATMIGIAYFRKPFTLFKLASIALVVLGVVGLSLAAKQAP